MHDKRASMRCALFGILLLASLFSAGCERRAPERPVADPDSRRATRSGEVVGFSGQYGSHVWLGIPFAKPPIGELRWRAPQPPVPWTGTRESLAFGSPCTQFASALGGVDRGRPGEPVGNEDCLYLNLYAPRFAATAVPSGDARLPVMVWIHGGGNSIGEGGFYDGGNLAVTEKVIVVTVNYRLGPFGWLRHAALRSDGTSETDRSGNFGTLDLIRGLEWVRENISAFGGDPGNVTVFGESAGGLNVFTLLLSPRATGLFHRGIVQSGGLWLDDATEAENLVDDAEPGDPSSSNEVLLRLLIVDGTAPNRAAAKAHLASMTLAQVAQYLHGKTNFEILSVYPQEDSTGMIEMPMVFREGAVLPAEQPMERLSRPDGYNRVPVMLGTNRDENKLFMFFNPGRVRRWLWIFPRLRDEQRYNLSAEYLSKMWKANGADKPASLMGAAQGPSVFVYRFDWDEEPRMLGADLSVMLGAAHGFEIPFVFGHFNLGREGNVIFTKDNEPARKTLSAQMMSYWAQFAYKGAPGRGRSGALPEWLPWDDSSANSPKFLVLDTAAGGGLRMSSDTLTQEAVLAAVDTDPRLSTQRDRCMIFRELATHAEGSLRQGYPTAGKSGCAEYPFEEYPWEH